MKKLVVLELDGNLAEQGFRITLQVSEEGQPQQVRIRGSLPVNPELAEHLEAHWQEKYRSLGLTSRLNCKKIIHKGSLDKRIAECRASANQLRQYFLAWLDSPTFLNIDRRLREQLSREEVIRLLISTESQQLQKLPWQEWDFFERYPQAEMAFSATEFEQFLSLPQQSAPGAMKILAILGHSQGIDTTEDRQQLEALPNAQIEFLVEPSRQQLNEQLWSQNWDLLFFAGHSETEDETGKIYLNPQESLSLQELKYGLRAAIGAGLQLAIFNSCDGSGLAQALEQLQIPQMIVMREAVPDQVAQAFLKYFLQAFAQGKPLYLAAREAREKLQGLEGEFPCASWLPVIYQNQAAVILNWKQPPTVQPRQEKILASQIPQPLQPWKRLLALLMMSCLTTCAIAGLRWFGKLQVLELWAYDGLTRIQPGEKPVQDPRLLVITIDEQDIQHQKNLGLQPQGSLADGALVKVLQELDKLNPAVVGLDIYHSHPFSSQLVTRLQQQDYPFYGICKARSRGETNGRKPPAAQDLAPQYWGFSDVVTDADGIVRRHLLTMRPKMSDPCSTDASLNLLMATHYLDIVTRGIAIDNTTESLTVGEQKFPKLTDHTSGYQGLDSRGSQIMLNYRSYHSPSNIARSVSLREILDNGIEPHITKQFREPPVVLIGVVAKGENYDDFFVTPYGEEIPGVFLQAQMISQVISSVLDERPLVWWWSTPREILWIGGWSLVGGAIVMFIREPWRRQLVIVMALGGLFAITYGLFIQAGWIPLIPPALALVIVAEVGCCWLVIQEKNG